MSGCSYDDICPECGGVLMCYSDRKPYDYVTGDCTECGFYYLTKEGQSDLDELNEMRIEHWDMEPLEELPQCAIDRLNEDTVQVKERIASIIHENIPSLTEEACHELAEKIRIRTI